MKVWIAFLGWDYEGDNVIGVYHTFEAARNKCLEDMGEDVSNFSLREKDGEFSARQGSQQYIVYSYDVE